MLFSLIIPTSAGVYLSIKEVTDPMTIYIINGCAMLAGRLYFYSLFKKSFCLKDIGFEKGLSECGVIPILIIETIPFIAGINNKDLSISSFMSLCFFMVCVGHLLKKESFEASCSNI
ncbi:hypothetical protein ACEQPO_04360 [Bacillus sp. SL00103]